MVKRHLKRIPTPRTWNIKRKETTFTTRPQPGSHKLSEGLALNTVLRDMIKAGENTKEIKTILNNKEILVDGKRRKETKFITGLMDIISIPETKENYRILYTEKGKITIKKIDPKEAQIKVCKIINKVSIKKGRIQITLSDGRNIITDKKEYKIGDSLVITLPKQEIKEHLKLEPGSQILITGGWAIGKTGTMTQIQGEKIIFKLKDKETETLKKYAYVVGKDKPAITL